MKNNTKRNSPDTSGPRLLWHDPIAMRLGFWFGWPFWALVIVVTFLAPALQAAWWLWLYVPPLGRCFIVFADLAFAGVLFAFAWALTSFGTHALTLPVRLTSFLQSACVAEYGLIEYIRQQYRGKLADSQKRSFVDELVNRPYAFIIFTRYVWRVGFVVLTIPVYLGMALLFADAIPQMHAVDAKGGRRIRLVHVLEVLRDVQMGMLAGSSTEHLPQFVNIAPQNVGEHVERGDADSSGETSRSTISIQEGADVDAVLRRAAVWEGVGIACSFLYVGLALILLPLQIGIVSSLNERLKSREFWETQLSV
jgi:hypothetical protein